MPVYDRRIEKTRQAIIEALEALLGEKRYTQITVQEIIDRANVGRTTFYTHFPTKDDLLKSCIEKNIDVFKRELFHNGVTNEPMFSVVNLLTHIKQHKRMMKGLLNPEVNELLFISSKAYLKDKLLEHFKVQGIETSNLVVPIDLLIHHITGSLIELIKWWFDTGMKEDPQKMEDYWLAMTMPVIQRIALAK